MTRNGHDWTKRLRTQARELETLPVEQAILDGELVALTADGASSFRELQEALSRKQTTQLTYQLFDLVYLNGYDLSAVPLIERKRALMQLLEAAGYEPGGIVRYSDHVQGQGPEFFEQACTLGLEGIISKRADAPYRSGRSEFWLKAKCTHQHAEFVVGGYTPPAGARSCTHCCSDRRSANRLLFRRQRCPFHTDRRHAGCTGSNQGWWSRSSM